MRPKQAFTLYKKLFSNGMRRVTKLLDVFDEV